MQSILFWIELIDTTLIGLFIGSFFNVVIYRMPRNESTVYPPSHCTSCNNKIKWYENIPVVSYLFLGGKCSNCNSKISIRYPIFEMVTALFMLFLWWNIAYPVLDSNRTIWSNIFLAMKLYSLLILLPISIIDIKHRIIPDKLTLTGLVTGILLAFMPQDITPLQSFLGVLAGGGTLFFIGFVAEKILHKEAMGGGDIKLMAFIGAIWGWKITLLSIFLASILGSGFGIVLILLRLQSKNETIPFGPYLSLAVVVSVLYGDTIIDAYLNFAGLN